jgi:glycosyltransferase involved in cell wall biosynthesis
MTPAVSVVVATYRRDELLARCLLHLLDQDLDAPFEIDVVDDAQSDSTQGVIEAVLKARPDSHVPITLLPGRSNGPATARNIGWRAARGEVIAFTDDDAYAPEATWLARGVGWFEDEEVAAVGGQVTVPADDPPTDFQRNVQALEDGEFLTCNAFYRRSALEAVGGFDERFTVPFREDSDLQYRVEMLGGRMVKDSELRIIHPAPRGRFAISLRLQRYSLFNALMYKKHPKRFRQRLQASPPLSYYGMLASGTLALFGAATGARRLSALSGTVWLALESRFFLKRIRGSSHAPRDLLDMAVTSVLIPPVSVYWRLRGAIKFKVLFF